MLLTATSDQSEIKITPYRCCLPFRFSYGQMNPGIQE